MQLQRLQPSVSAPVAYGEDALEREYDLATLIAKARKIEATEIATKELEYEPPSSSFQLACADTESPETKVISKVGKRGGGNTLIKAKERKVFWNKRPQLDTNKIMCCAGCRRTNCNRGQNCAAENAFCNNCGKRGHFAAVCMKQTKGISTVTTIKRESLQNLPTLSNSHKIAEVLIGTTKSKIQVLVDTGSEVNILLESMVPPNVRRIFPTPITLQPYGSSLIKPKGKITLDTTWHKKPMRATWVVIGDKDLFGQLCILISCALAQALVILSFSNPQSNVNNISYHTSQSSKTSKDFHNLLSSTHPSVANILAKYESVFSGLGKLKTNLVHFHLKPDAKPVIQPPRHIPYHPQARIDKLICDMEDDGVIEQHSGPVTWLANPVLVPKPDGNIRITVDLRSLNQALQNPHLPKPRVDDVLPMFNGKSVFSKLDLKTAFHQLA